MPEEKTKLSEELSSESKEPEQPPEGTEVTEEAKEEPDDSGQKPAKVSRLHRFKHWYATHKKLSIPLSVLLLLIILAAVPWTRYQAAGLVLKQDLVVKVLDATTKSPVSGATVSAGGTSALSDGSGKASLPGLKVGDITVKVTKNYYKDAQISSFVPILKAKSTPSITLQATGRQVKITIVNSVSRQALAGVDITLDDVKAKTDKSGKAVVVVPIGKAVQKATLSLEGYNGASVEVKVSDKTIAENAYSLTPSGKIYYLSNRTGKLNVMKANLDGSDEKVVLEGTGNEDKNRTIFLPSPDWKYLALLTKRLKDDTSHQLYIISTSDDRLTTADQSPSPGSASFQVDGWLGSYLVYRVTRNDLKSHDLGYQKLKSYNGATGKITLLDQTLGEVEDSYNVSEYYQNVFLMRESVLFAESWSQIYTKPRDNLLNSISPGGQNSKTVAKYDAKTYYVSYIAKPPSTIYIAKYPNNGTGATTYDSYSVGDSGSKQTSLTSDQFNKSYPAYILSPSGKKSAYSEERDGKTAVITAEPSGGNEKIVAKLDEHSLYGWFSDQYLLTTKKNKELYIMSADGDSPVKITDFQPTSDYDYYY